MAEASNRGEITLRPDYSAGLPLWGDWEELKLPLSLLVRLYRWQRTFDRGFNPERGWDTAQNRDAWAAEASRLVDDLQRVIGKRAELTVDLWPLPADADQ